METRRSLIRRLAKGAAAIGLSGGVIAALSEQANAAGCGWQWTYFTTCKYGTLYRVYRWCCTNSSGGQTCTNTTEHRVIGTC